VFEITDGVFNELPSTNTFVSFRDTRSSSTMYTCWLVSATVADVSIQRFSASSCGGDGVAYQLRTISSTSRWHLQSTAGLSLFKSIPGFSDRLQVNLEGQHHSAVALAVLLTFLVDAGSIVIDGLVVFSSKLYANSFLGILNARQLTRTEQVRFIEGGNSGTFNLFSGTHRGHVNGSQAKSSPTSRADKTQPGPALQLVTLQ